MSFPTFNDVADFSAPQQTQLQQHDSYLQGYLGVQHKDDGSHGDVTADSLHLVKGNPTTGTATGTGNLTVDGTTTMGGSLTATGDIVADNPTTPLTLGAAVGTSGGNVGIIGPGLDLNGLPATSPTGRWTFVLEDTGATRSLYLLERKTGSDCPFQAKFYLGAYFIKPHPTTNGAIGVNLGDPNDAAGNGRWQAIYGKTIDASTGFTLNTSATSLLKIIQTGSFNDGVAHVIGNVPNASGQLVITAGSSVSVIPFWANGGGGVAWHWTALNPGTGWIINSAGLSFSFTDGSNANTYTVTFNNGSGDVGITRTAGTAAYTTSCAVYT